MNLEFIEATTIPDSWFQCVYNILEKGRKYIIDRGSYVNQQRLEFDYITIHIKHPHVRPLLPEIPAALGIPNPVEEGYLEEYLPYLMTPVKNPNEKYTYGQRLSGWCYDYEYASIVNQIEEVINMYKKDGYNTNQACMSVSVPEDIDLDDPPCLRQIDTRISNNKLHFIIYFRSWDLWGGFPANLGGLQLLKEYMAAEIGVDDGEIIASSKGLHIYSYVWELARLRAYKNG
jgi:thymidylate synthase